MNFRLIFYVAMLSTCNTVMLTAGYSLPGAVATGEIEEVKRVLDRSEVNLNDCAYQDETALHIAATRGYVNIAWLLRDKGATVNLCDAKGDTPLHRAAFAGHYDIVELLIQRKALVNASNRFGATPLLHAILGGRRAAPGIVQLLLENGASIASLPEEMLCGKSHDTVASWECQRIAAFLTA